MMLQLDKMFRITLFLIIIGFSQIICQDAPKIRPFSFPVNPVINTPVLVYCLAEKGAQPISYQWFRNNQPINKEDGITTVLEPISNALGLAIQSVSSKHSANYTCSARNNFGEDKFTATLKIKGPPVWLSTSSDVKANLGQDIELTCQASNFPPPLITWLKKNENSQHLVITGEMMSIKKAKKEDEGSYECVAVNELGKLTKLIRIEISDPPKIQPFSFPNEIQLNHPSLTTLCTAYAGDKPISFEWFKDGKPIQLNENFIVRNSDMYSLLEMRNLNGNHIGNYTCLAKNQFGTDSFTTDLIMKAQPFWIDEPNNAKVTLGDKLEIICSAKGYPIPRISWSSLKENQLLSSQSASNSLVFESASNSVKGEYECKAENGIGSPLLKIIRVDVVVPAEFKEKNAVVSVKKGNILELECSPEGDSPVTVKWSKDSTTLDKLDQSRYHVSDQPTQNGLKSVLTVNSADIKDNGLYVCLAENSFGKDERNIRVTIIEPPTEVTNFAVQRVWSRSASLVWNRPFNTKTSILGYIIRYWKVSSFGANDRLNEVNITSSMDSYLVKNLEPGTHYEVNIIALNEVGQSQPSRTISFDTGEEEPSAAPSDLQIVARGPTTLRVAWKPPPRGTWNGKLLGYYIGYRHADDFKTPYSFKTFPTDGSNLTHEYLLSSLIKSTKYTIIVKTYNSVGSGPASQEIVVETLSGDVPTSPRLFVTSVTTDSITLKYSLSSASVNKIQTLNIHFKEDGETIWREMDFFFDSKETGEYTLQSLNPNTIYMIYLTSSNENGLSDPSPIIRTKTFRSTGESFAIGSVFETGPTGYWDVLTISSIVTASTIIVVVVALAFVYVKKVQLETTSKPNFEFCIASQAGTLAYNKSLPNFGTARFTDADNNMPLMSGTIDPSNHYPVSYSNLPTENRHSKLVDPKHIYDFPR